MIGGLAATGAFAGLAALLKYFTSNGKEMPPKKRYAPCIDTPKAPLGPIDTVFELPIQGVCPTELPQYDLVYINPVNAPLMNPDIYTFNSSSEGLNKTLSDALNGSSTDPKIVQNNPNIEPFCFAYNDIIQTQYFPMTVNPTAFKTANALVNANLALTESLTNVSVAVSTSQTVSQEVPINLCPQTFAYGTAATGGTGAAGAASANTSGTDTIFSTCLPLPVIRTTSASVSSGPRNAILFPGLSSVPQGQNGINFPMTPGPPLSATQSNKRTVPNIVNPGLASELYLLAYEDVTFYLELQGAAGGSVNIYSNGIDPVTQTPVTVQAYQGGQPGTVFGLYTLKKSEVLKIFLGSPGDNSTQWLTPNVYNFDGNGQGGQGTMYGGTNGGGASYAVHYQMSYFQNNAAPGLAGLCGPIFNNGPLTAALSNQPGGLLVCVAGGGGGASRNASGGNAGLNAADPSIGGLRYGTQQTVLVNGQAKPISAFGSAGGPLLVAGPAAEARTRATNGISGGGGAQTVGGASAIANPTSERSCFGARLQPFVGNTSTSSGSGGGSATATDIGSGGGGGGGGLFGGGAGAWNNAYKPNNLHGAGGGGSSSFGLLQRVGQQNISLNALRSTSKWPVADTPFDVLPWPGQENTFSSAKNYGQLILGWPVN